MYSLLTGLVSFCLMVIFSSVTYAQFLLKPRPWKIPLLRSSKDSVFRQTPDEMFPQPRHVKPELPGPADVNSRKLRKLIKKFEPRYMSVSRPKRNSSRGHVFTRREIFARMSKELKNLHFTVPGSDRELGNRASRKLRLWLWNLTTCKVLPLWKDYGPRIWPRYVNLGQCDTKKSCSYPKGMSCTPSKYRRIYVLFWVCSKSNIQRRGKRCIWVPLPVDVIEKCQCSC